MKRPGKPEGPYYFSHQTLDSDHRIIIGLTVTPGDVHDAVPYLAHLEEVHRRIPLKTAAADSTYDFHLTYRELERLGITFFVRPQGVHDRTQAVFTREAFRYDETEDVYICPNGKRLGRRGLYRSASGLFWQYMAERQDCGQCPVRANCLSAHDRRGGRKLEDSYFKPSVQRSRARQDTAAYREALKARQVWCEGTFSLQKRCHSLTRTLRRGLEAVEDHCLLSAVALNLKRLMQIAG